jgi:hypothetical protein
MWLGRERRPSHNFEVAMFGHFMSALAVGASLAGCIAASPKDEIVEFDRSKPAPFDCSFDAGSCYRLPTSTVLGMKVVAAVTVANELRGDCYFNVSYESPKLKSEIRLTPLQVVSATRTGVAKAADLKKQFKGGELCEQVREYAPISDLFLYPTIE